MSKPENKSQKLLPVKLIVSDDEQPTVQLKAGMRFEVVSVSVVQSNLTDLVDSDRIGARLCGGSGTCLAIVDIATPVVNPAP